MEIVKLDPSKKKHAVNVLCVAFFDYPEFDFYFPDPEKRKRCLPWYLGKVMNTALRYGEVYTTQEISGVAFILPPGHSRISQWEYVLCGFLPAPFVLGMQDFIRSQQGEEFIGDMHEKIMQGRPHYYLWGLVVDPAQKRKGIGTALLGPILAKADAEKSPSIWRHMMRRMWLIIKGRVFTWQRRHVSPNSTFPCGVWFVSPYKFFQKLNATISPILIRI